MSPSPRTITKPQAGGCPCPAPGRGLTCSEKTAREKWRTERGRTAATRVLSSGRSHSAGLSFPPFHRLLATSSLFLSVSTHNQENPNKYNTRDAPSFKNTNPKPPLTPYHPLATVSAEADSNRNFSVLLFLGRFVNWLICPFPPLLFFFLRRTLWLYLSVPLWFYLQTNPESNHFSKTILPPRPSTALSGLCYCPSFLLVPMLKSVLVMSLLKILHEPYFLSCFQLFTQISPPSGRPSQSTLFKRANPTPTSLSYFLPYFSL